MALLIDNISYKYPQQKDYILQDFSISFPTKKITAVTGPNGCGKTTLAKLIMNILKPDKGNILIDNLNTKDLSIAETGRNIGFVMQNPSQQLFCTSVEEEISYGLINLKLGAELVVERVQEYMNYFDIAHLAKRFPLKLSSGEKQRVILAAVLAMKPQYLLLDEPTTALDIYRCTLLGDLIKKIRDDLGCGIIFISHDRAFIDKYADQEIKMF